MATTSRISNRIYELAGTFTAWPCFRPLDFPKWLRPPTKFGYPTSLGHLVRICQDDFIFASPSKWGKHWKFIWSQHSFISFDHKNDSRSSDSLRGTGELSLRLEKWWVKIQILKRQISKVPFPQDGTRDNVRNESSRRLSQRAIRILQRWQHCIYHDNSMYQGCL